MSFKIKNIYLKHKKIDIYKDFSLELKSGKIITCLYNKKKEKKIFLDLLLGNIYPYKGSIYFNNHDVTTFKQKDRKIKKVSKNKNIFPKLLTMKSRMLLTSFLDPFFIFDSFYNYYSKIIHSTIKVGKNIYQIKLNYQLNKIFKDYVSKYLYYNNDLIVNFFEKIYKLEKENINSILNNDKYTLTKKWCLNLIYHKNKLLIAEKSLFFLQNFYDSISQLKNLRYSCNCEIDNVKNKKVKKFKKELRFLEINNITDKYLQIISIHIIKKRVEIFSYKRKIKLTKWSLISNMNQFNLKQDLKKKINRYIYKPYLLKDVNLIKKITNIKEEIKNFLDREEILINELLESEIIPFKNEIIYLIHQYHLYVLEGKVKNITNKEYKALQKNKDDNLLKKEEFYNLYSNFYKKGKILAKQLGINLNFLASPIGSFNFNKVKLFILDALLSDKEILIFDSLIDGLNLEEQKELELIIKNIQLKYLNIKIIFLTNNLIYNNEFKSDYLLLTNYSNSLYKNNEFNTNYLQKPKNIIIYKTIFRKNVNLINFNLKNNNNNNLYKYLYSKISDLKNYYIFINPLTIGFKQTAFNDLSLIGKIKKIKKKSNRFTLVVFKYEKFKRLNILLNNYNKSDIIGKNIIYIKQSGISIYKKEK